MNVGVIGAGWAAAEHCKTLARSEGTVIVAVSDLDLDRAQRLAQDHGARAYETSADLIETEHLDAVVVATPPGSHRDPMLQAIDAGLAVFVEKPIARTLEDARAITAAADRGGIVCAIGYQWRAVAALDVLDAELAGQDLRFLQSEGVGITQARRWFADEGQSGRLIAERGSHHLDLQRRVGGEVVSVQALGSSTELAELAEVDELGPASSIETSVSLTLRFASGALGAVHVVWVPEGYPSRHRLTVLGTSSKYELDLDPDFSLRGDSGVMSEPETMSEHPFAAGLLRFLDAVRNGDPTAVFSTPGDAAKTLAVVVACECALATGATVQVESV